MSVYVVDACVAIKWFIPEQYADDAILLLHDDNELWAPDLLSAEFANVLCKKYRRHELTKHEVLSVSDALQAVPINLHASTDILLSTALEIALDLGQTVYDCVYLALAIQLSAKLISADQRFYKAISVSPFKDGICLVGNGD